jgi:hypothetical protein
MNNLERALNLNSDGDPTLRMLETTTYTWKKKNERDVRYKYFSEFFMEE